VEDSEDVDCPCVDDDELDHWTCVDEEEEEED